MDDRRARGFCLQALVMIALAILSGSASIGEARADPDCIARILSDAPALEAPEQVKSKSSGTFGPITHVKVAKAGGQMYYCAAKSYCYNSNSFQIVTPCRFKLDKSAGSDDYFEYSAR